MNPRTVLWVYIILLVVGGLIGFLKAKSKISLVTSAVAATLLVLTTVGIFAPGVGSAVADIIMAALLVVFAIRLTKTRKFMPSGIMLVITLAALALRHIFR